MSALYNDLMLNLHSNINNNTIQITALYTNNIEFDIITLIWQL